MRRVILFIISWYACAFLSVTLAQEVKGRALPDSLPESLLSPDTVVFKLDLRPEPLWFLKPEEGLFKDSVLNSILNKPRFDGFGEKKKPPKPILPWEITPDLSFHIVPSRWDLPLLGPTLTFAPTVSYQLYDKMILYGGVSFTQYTQLATAQRWLAPDWPLRSNITTQAFGGFAYALHDRVTLHGSFQHSLYNQLPSNLMMFAPAYNTMIVGADVDIWQGLGVTVDRVWDFDRSGRVRQYTRYSPYINAGKFLKFLGL
jgi:hypothetical protein